MSDRLKVGIIGLGVMGKNHARVITELEDFELVGLVDPLEELNPSSNFSSKLMNLDKLIPLQPDYCVVAAPTAYHLDIARSLFNANVNMLIEKPLAQNFDSATEMLILSNKSVSKVGIGHIERFNSAAKQAKRRIEEGFLGEIFQISTSRQGPFPARIADVGVILDLATHDLDLCSWMVESDYSSVAAKIAFRAGRIHEDLLSVTGSIGKNIVANHLVNWLSPNKERATVILGERGALRSDTLNSDLVFFENGTNISDQASINHFRGVTQGEVTHFSFNKPEPLKEEHLSFRKFIRGEKTEIATLEDGFKAVKVAGAVLESANTNRTVHL